MVVRTWLPNVSAMKTVGTATGFGDVLSKVTYKGYVVLPVCYPMADSKEWLVRVSLELHTGPDVLTASYDSEETYPDKAEADKKTREWGVRQLEALQPFKVVQRILAFAATFLWIFTGVNILAAMWVEAFYNKTITTVVDGVETIITHEIHLVESLLTFAMSDYVLWPVTSVYVLYFSGGVIDSWKRKNTDK